MRRLNRWRYWVPAAMLVVVLVLGVQYTLGRLARSSIMRAAGSVVGGKVELGGARVSLVSAQVTLHDLRIADANEPARSLLQADGCRLSLSPGALLRNKAVAQRGEIVGLRIGTPGGASDSSPTPVAAGFDSRPAELIQGWFDHLAMQFDRDLVSQLESVRLADELVARWPQQSRRVEDRLRQLKRRAAELDASVGDAQVNPLRHAEFMDRLPGAVAALEADFDQLAAEVQALPDAVEKDRRAIIAARGHDEQLLRDALDVGRIDPAALAAYLLQDELAGPTGELVGWLRWARQVMPAEMGHPGGGRRQAPDLRIGSLAIGGTACLGGQPVELAGTITDLATDPALAGRPTEVRMATAGPLPLELAATIDRTQAVAEDELSARCRNVCLPKVWLGRSDGLRLSLSPSVASAKIHVAVKGEDLSGQVELVQAQLHVTPSIAGKLEQVRLADALEQSLRGVGSVTVRLRLAGTLDKPRWTLQSDLGPAVAEAMDRALQQAVERHTRELLARSQRHVDEQLARLDRQIADQQAALLPQLAGSARALDEIAQHEHVPDRLSPEYVGRRLPAGSLFR